MLFFLLKSKKSLLKLLFCEILGKCVFWLNSYKKFYSLKVNRFYKKGNATSEVMRMNKRNQKRSGLNKEKASVIAASVFVLSALTLTGVYMAAQNNSKTEENRIDFAPLECGTFGWRETAHHRSGLHGTHHVVALERASYEHIRVCVLPVVRAGMSSGSERSSGVLVRCHHVFRAYHALRTWIHGDHDLTFHALSLTASFVVRCVQSAGDVTAHCDHGGACVICGLPRVRSECSRNITRH